MATTTPYIVRRAPQNGAKVAHFISDQLHVSRVEQTRATGRTIGGMFREVEGTGKNRPGILRIRTGRDTTRGDGQRREHSDHVRTTPAAEIKKVVRRVRPEELAELEQIDADIEVVEQELKQLRAKRAEAAATAWAKGHVITAKELEALADLPATPSYGLTAQQQADIAAAHDEIRRMFAG